MKRIIWTGSGTFLIIFVGFFYNQTSSYEQNLAAVLKIESEAVKKWQQQGGLTQTLALGSSGTEVRLLQRALMSDTQTTFNVTPTGYFGNETVKAIKAFQLMHGIDDTGTLGPQTRAKINNLYFNELCPQTGEFNDPDLIYTRVDKTHALPEGYIPDHLITLTNNVRSVGIACLRKEAADALLLLFADAEKENIHLAVTSSFRREEIQKVLHTFWLTFDYRDNIDKVADPLHSEHQLGTAVDLSGRSNNYNGADVYFAHTPEGKWLEANAYKYGFIQSYPEGKKHITGYDYEPWHYRYIGTERARVMYERGITQAEFFDEKKDRKDKKKN